MYRLSVEQYSPFFSFGTRSEVSLSLSLSLSSLYSGVKSPSVAWTNSGNQPIQYYNLNMPYS
jgi:hypothetical protein